MIVLLLLPRSRSVEPLGGRGRYIFWTGGFDSTFRICQLLHNHRSDECIVPLYITDPHVDDIASGRQNRQVEINTMKKLRGLILNHFPIAPHRLRPTVYMKKVDFDYRKGWVDKCMRELTKDGCATRLHTQYRSMAIISLMNDIIIELGTEGNDTGAVTKYFLPWLVDDRIGDNAPPQYKLFQNLRWPLALYKKSDMLREAMRDGYHHILGQTFSCWYPVKGEPCGKCHMCRERLKEETHLKRKLV